MLFPCCIRSVLIPISGGVGNAFASGGCDLEGNPPCEPTVQVTLGNNATLQDATFGTLYLGKCA